MTNNLKTYLEWRFKRNNHPKYLKYCNEWINNLFPSQIQYFEKEMIRLHQLGIYH